MIARYTRSAMGAIWSEQHKYECWLEVELAASEALAGLGEVPAAAAQSLRAHAAFDLARIQEIEREVRHDVIAFTTAVAEQMKARGEAEASRWLHFGLTSNDVVDTAQALQIRDASAIISAGLDELLDALKTLAWRHKDTLQIGRTHGMHAEPITFGLKVALWWDEMERHRARFRAAARRDSRREDLGRCRHLRPHRPGGRRRDLQSPRPEGRPHHLPSTFARSARPLHCNSSRYRLEPR